MKFTRKKTFNEKAQRQDPAVFDYAREVTQLWQNFPEVKDKVVFLDLCARDMVVYPDGGALKKQDIQALLEKRKNLMDKASRYRLKEKRSFCQSWPDGRRFIFLYTQKRSYLLLGKASTMEQKTMFAFDHELGHALIPRDVLPDQRAHFRESIADAYAVIRHFQRYGAESAVLDAIPGNRAFNTLFKDEHAKHLTSPVVEQLLTWRYYVDWDKMTPTETINMALQMAQTYAMDSASLEELDRELEKCHGKWDNVVNGGTKPLKNLADIILATSSATVFKYGAMALQSALDGHVCSTPLTGPYWDDVRRKLAERRKEFPALKDPLFDAVPEVKPVKTSPHSSCA